MGNTNFDPHDLDEILGDVTKNVAEVNQSMSDPLPTPGSACNDAVATDSSGEVIADAEKIYSEMAKLVESGNKILRAAEYAVEADPNGDGILAGAASVLSAVKETVGQFTKLHSQHLRHRQQIELENLKQKNRMEIIKTKMSMDSLDVPPGNNSNSPVTSLVPCTQEEIVRLLCAAEEESIDKKEDE